MSAGLGVLWLVDVVIVWCSPGGMAAWLPVLSGLAALSLVLGPERWLSTEARAGLAAAGSMVLTASVLLMGRPLPDWGLLETACLLALLARTCSRVRRPGVAVALAAALGVCVIDEPLRTEGSGITLSYPFLLTFAVGAAIGVGCFLRAAEARRERAAAAVRLAERLRLAQELHDFVSHHITGIIAQAHAGSVIHRSAPEKIGPIMDNIAEAGQRTMDSMRRLLRVLRDEVPAEYRGEPCLALAKLVSSFNGQGDGSVARLEITAAARRLPSSAEVWTVVHRVVQEGLTNVRRHAPGTQATVRLDLTRDGLLRVDVHNTALRRQGVTPVGGPGGHGLAGLRERMEAVGGTLTAGPTDEGGWRLVAHAPTRAAGTPGGERPAGARLIFRSDPGPAVRDPGPGPGVPGLG